MGDQQVATFIYWADGGSTVLNLGDERVTLRAAADAASRLAEVVERVREKHQEPRGAGGQRRPPTQVRPPARITASPARCPV
jgi:hypothetical protein